MARSLAFRGSYPGGGKEAHALEGEESRENVAINRRAHPDCYLKTERTNYRPSEGERMKTECTTLFL